MTQLSGAVCPIPERPARSLPLASAVSIEARKDLFTSFPAITKPGFLEEAGFPSFEKL